MNLAKYLIVLVLPLFFACQKSTTVSITLDPSECGKDQACIVYNDKNYNFVENEEGELSVVVPEVNYPTYCRVKVKKMSKELFLTPGAVFTAKPNFTTKDPLQRLTGSGDNRVENNYLNARSNYRYTEKYFIFTEEEFTEGLEGFINGQIAELEAQDLNKVFTVVEGQRLRFSALQTFLAYYKYRKYKDANLTFTPVIEDYIMGCLKSNEKFCFLDEYKTMAGAASKIFATNGQEVDVHKNIVQTVHYIVSHFTNEKLINGLINHFATDYIQEYSVSSGGELINFYNQNVTDELMKKEFALLIEEKTRLAKGQPSPIFNYPDVDGNMVSLTDFKGKAVYIDLWATWCGPCCKEIPYIKALEHELEGKNIVFVSISMDKDVKKWKAMLESQKMGGVQLNFDGNRDFSKAYDSKSIPRFILIDADGNIVDSNAPRPSDPKLKDMLRTLL
ncbi:TlpA family protein disulfide reductase [Carboxylicivirga marina]|uniref:TlpA family protein disulfide reductase n=1 Tax=Carboxylicivirga marina TaxID=2800988 RepID=A0ABS1HKK7_9BACT|nr:TlpA disulfide reductase family protein [Carboxylicivirga marina]MBK3518200.1 TlpA family protein disulfide reductase [Carboxylicivirga marina]